MVRFLLLTIALAVAMVAAGISTAVSWRKPDTTAECWMVGTLLIITLWSMFQLILLTGGSEILLVIVAGLSYSIAPYIAITVFLFAVYFTGREQYLSTPRLATILVVPLPVFLATMTEYRYRHELAFVDLTYCADCAGTALTYDFGPILYVYAATAYVFAIVAAYLMYLKVVRSRNVYRKLSLHVLVVTAVLMSANAATFLGLSPFEHMVLLPIAFLIFAISIVGTTTSVRFVQLAPIDAIYSKISSAFGDLVPLARDIVIEEIDNGVVILDEDNRIVDANEMGKRILSPDGDRVVGKVLTDIVPKDLFVSGTTKLLDPGITGRFEAVWIEGHDGTDRCYDISLTGIDSSGSKATGARVAIVHDVTEREQRKQKLEAQTRKLEAQNEKLDDFASMVSHDLRNPLNVAEGYVEAIRGEIEEDSQAATYADEISISHKRMREIIDDVLVLAREGQSIEETEWIDLEEIVRTAWANVETEDATLSVVAERGTTIDANRSSLLRALENLIRNAVEHAPGEEGETDITVRIGVLADSTGFYVEDTGAGIPEAQRERVLEHAYTTNEGGTGFGLSIVQEVAEGHDWTITVAESDDGGARFEFRGAEINQSQ